MTHFFKIAALVIFASVSSLATAQENHFGTEGINHLGLSVSKLDESVSFFVDTLGWKTVGGQPDYPSVFVNNGQMTLTLWQVEDPATATPFHRRKNVDLHHLAITVESLGKLHALHNKVKDMENINVEFAP